MATKKSTNTSAKKTPAKKVAAKIAAAKETNTVSETKSAASKAPATHQQIAHLAEQLWNERGRPHGSAHIDWHHAEQKLNG